MYHYTRGRGGPDHMVVRFTTTYVQIAFRLGVPDATLCYNVC